MAQIYQMSPQLANLIAAGEVVERPGSVVKELLENAVDAGAKHVTVELRHGGISYLRVTDDGSGILPEDVRTAFLRHATSKLRRESELSAIGTLGFRGEALAAIASVSRVDLFTRTKHYDEGVQITIEGGKETGYGETGCPLGTTVVVRDLFFNVPARAKFLKKDATEAAYAESAAAQIAISHPEVAFRLIRDGREIFSTPGDGKMRSAIYACGGRDLAGSLLAISGSLGEIAVSGYISPTEITRATRAQQAFYINGRYVRSRLLSAAVEEAYKGRIMTGRYPVCYLDLRLNLSAVDVNVHPAKLEVKFSREKEVFSAVYQSVAAALDANGELQELRQKPNLLAPREDHLTGGQQKMRLEVERRESVPTFAESYQSARAAVAQKQPASMPYQTKSNVPPAAEDKLPPLVEPVLDPLTFDPVKPSVSTAAPEEQKTEQSPPASPEDRAPETGPEPPQVRVLGEAFRTYVIAEDKDGLWLIDKHAAHERMLFNRIKAGLDGQASQLLLSPKTVTLSQVEKDACLEHADLLRKAGFGIEDFGRGALLVREAPMYLDEQDIPFVLSEIGARLLSHRGADNELLDDLLKSISCKAAVKAGMDTDAQELQQFAEAVLADNEVRNCPHGRPCVTYLSCYQLEKLFKRIV